jgi:hypothetical protein
MAPNLASGFLRDHKQKETNGMGLLGDSGNGHAIDATAFLDSGIPKRIGELVSMGLLCAIGTTRDRGAISIQLTHDGDWDREYFRHVAEAEEWLDRAATILRARGLGDPTPEPPGPPKPRRARQRLT